MRDEQHRRAARDRAFDARNGLAAMIKHSGCADAYIEKMQLKLIELWDGASEAMGDLGENETVFKTVMSKVGEREREG